MSTTSSKFHIPFPRTFLAVNTPAKKSSNPTVAAVVSEPTQSVHGFLSNSPAAIMPHHQSRSSISSNADSTSGASDAGTLSAPSSPAAGPVDSPVLGPKIFAPLAVNAKCALPPPTSAKEMSELEKSAFLSNRH